MPCPMLQERALSAFALPYSHHIDQLEAVAQAAAGKCAGCSSAAELPWPVSLRPGHCSHEQHAFSAHDLRRMWRTACGHLNPQGSAYVDAR